MAFVNWPRIRDGGVQGGTTARECKTSYPGGIAHSRVSAFFQEARAVDFPESLELSGTLKDRLGLERRFDPEGEIRSVERCVQRETARGDAFDGGERACRPGSGEVVEVHPEQVIEMRFESINNGLKDLETLLLAVAVHSRPVTNEDGGFLALDDFDKAS